MEGNHSTKTPAPLGKPWRSTRTCLRCRWQTIAASVSETLETAPMVHGVGRIIHMNQSQSCDDYRPTSMLPTMIRPTPLQTSETVRQVTSLFHLVTGAQLKT